VGQGELRPVVVRPEPGGPPIPGQGPLALAGQLPEQGPLEARPGGGLARRVIGPGPFQGFRFEGPDPHPGPLPSGELVGVGFFRAPPPLWGRAGVGERLTLSWGPDFRARVGPPTPALPHTGGGGRRSWPPHDLLRSKPKNPPQ